MTSFYEGFPRLQLIPPFKIFDNCSYEYIDSIYMQWIFSNQIPYINFMDIVAKLHEDHKICILVMPDDSYDMIYESLQSILSARYGIVSNIVNSIEDWFDLTDVGPRAPEHILNMDMDKDNFLSYLMEQQKNGGV